MQISSLPIERRDCGRRFRFRTRGSDPIFLNAVITETTCGSVSSPRRRIFPKRQPPSKSHQSTSTSAAVSGGAPPNPAVVVPLGPVPETPAEKLCSEICVGSGTSNFARKGFGDSSFAIGQLQVRGRAKSGRGICNRTVSRCHKKRKAQFEEKKKHTSAVRISRISCPQATHGSSFTPLTLRIVVFEERIRKRLQDLSETPARVAEG